RDFGKNFQWLVATIASCAEGIDGWQYVCANVVWLSKSEDGIMNQQALGRLVRTGQTRQVTSYEVVANDTYDTGQLSKSLEEEIAMRKVLRGRDWGRASAAGQRGGGSTTAQGTRNRCLGADEGGGEA